MTVCIATIARHGAIMMAADRMLSTDFRKYEPESSKIYMHANRSLFVMWAGDSQLQGELLQDSAAVSLANESAVIPVSEAATLFAEAYGRALERHLNRWLRPRYDLTLADFRAGRHTLHSRTVAFIERAFGEAEIGDAGLIVAGIDATGPHIWRVINGEPFCHDLEGFAAIGTGAPAAVDLLRAVGYSPKRTQRETLLFTFLAKKRGEGSPTVGTVTDMASVVKMGAGGKVDAEVRDRVEAAYKQLLEGERSVLKATLDSFDESMQQLMVAQGYAAASEAPPPKSDNTSASDQT